MLQLALRIALALVLVSPGFARAQGMSGALAASTPQDRATFQTEYMKDKLALTPEQLPKVSALNLETAQKMEPVIKGGEGPLVKVRLAREIEGQKEAALQGMLTPEQFQKFLAMREEMKQKLEQKLADKAAGRKTP